MEENVMLTSLTYTVHGVKRPHGQLAMVNQKLALAYVEKKKVVGYTYIEEMMKAACTSRLPEYKLDF